MEETIKIALFLYKSMNLYKMSDTSVYPAEDIPINLDTFYDSYQLNNKVSWEESFQYIVVPNNNYFNKYQRRIEILNYEAWRKKNKEIAMNLYK